LDKLAALWVVLVVGYCAFVEVYWVFIELLKGMFEGILDGAVIASSYAGGGASGSFWVEAEKTDGGMVDEVRDIRAEMGVGAGPARKVGCCWL
jgi:hypothetical protein